MTIKKQVRKLPTPGTRLGAYLARQIGTRKGAALAFCQKTGINQGLLSKILNDGYEAINFETAVRLAIAAGIPPSTIFNLLPEENKNKYQQLLTQALEHEYGQMD